MPLCAATVPALSKSRLARLTWLTSVPPVLRKSPLFVKVFPPLKTVKSASESKSNVAPAAFTNVLPRPMKRRVPVPSSVVTAWLRIVAAPPRSFVALPDISMRPSFVSVPAPPVAPPCQA